MKKLIFLLFPFLMLAQNPTNFPYGIKNTVAPSNSTPSYFVTQEVDGVHKKTPAAIFEKTSNKQNDLTVDGIGVKYPTVDAVNGGISAIKKQFEHTFVKESKPRTELSEYIYSGTVRTVGSGGTYATITAAFNAAVSGDILQLADGVYDTAAESGGYLLLNSTTKRILIRGNSTNNASVIIRQSAVATYCVRVRTSNEITFQNLTVESNQTTPTLTLNQDTASSPVIVFFDNCVIRNTGTGSVKTIYLSGLPVNSCKFEFTKCDIIQNSNVSSVALYQDDVSDAASLLYTIPIILDKCTILGRIGIVGSTTISVYDCSLICSQDNVVFSIGQDVAVPIYFKSSIDVRNCLFTYIGAFTNHSILLGRGTKNVYFVNNSIFMPSGNNSISLGLVVKSTPDNIDDVVIEGNYIEAPRPLYLKGALRCSIRYNTTFSNWSDTSNGYGFELNNPLNVDGEISTIENIVEFNNFSGKIGAIGLTYAGTTTAIYSFNLNNFNSNKYNVPTGGNYINTPSTTWETKYLTTKNDSNSILKYY